jgi:hypothetical protein
MDFHDFYGDDPKVWLDNCKDFFDMYNIPEGMWVTAAKVHLKGNAGKWYQAFKQNNSFKSWTHFCYEVEKQFGSEDYNAYMDQLLDLRQTATVEEYTTQFQSFQYGVSIHHVGFDEMFFTKQYIRGLKDDIRVMVESQMPPSVIKAAALAKIQQQQAERAKSKHKPAGNYKQFHQQKHDPKTGLQPTISWKD